MNEKMKEFNLSEFLSRSSIEGNILKLPNEQLEREDYLQVKKALEGIGGHWKGGKVSGFVFDENPSTLLKEIIKGKEINLKKDFQFFETPDQLANQLVSLSDIKKEHTILEPSAGRGSIVKAINRAYPDKKIDCFELTDINIKFIEKIPTINLIGKDFIKSNPSNLYDRIIANPPFTKNQDIDHIRKMWDYLINGGRLVTVSSTHWKHSNNKKEKEFKEWLISMSAKVIDLNSGTFKQSGTLIESCIIIINKKR